MAESHTTSDNDGRRRRWPGVVVIVFGPALIALISAYVYFTGGRFAETENAYVQADKVSVSAKVSGQITRVLVEENRRVEPGQVLFQLDEEPFRITLAHAQARLQGAKMEIAELKASFRQMREEMELERTNVAYFQREFKRQEKLARRGVASEVRLDEARHNLAVAHQRVAVARQNLSRIRASLGGSADTAVERDPRYLEAKAERDRAALDLRYAVVVAPIAGIAGRVPEPGDYTRAGVPVMNIVSDKGVWIEANFKETDLTHVRPGQSVTARVDTYPDREWRAVVDSISQATGAEFALLPPQNATGNWVKVVQRIPVRIEIETAEGDPPLRAGMSVLVKIDTGHERPIPDFILPALSWIDAVIPSSYARAGRDK
jgi:membrane fusion protein (multidrug efflux system)